MQCASRLLLRRCRASLPSPQVCSSRPVLSCCSTRCESSLRPHGHARERRQRGFAAVAQRGADLCSARLSTS